MKSDYFIKVGININYEDAIEVDFSQLIKKDNQSTNLNNLRKVKKYLKEATAMIDRQIKINL